jgi:hypothetical protein
MVRKIFGNPFAPLIRDAFFCTNFNVSFFSHRLADNKDSIKKALKRVPEPKNLKREIDNALK